MRGDLASRTLTLRLVSIRKNERIPESRLIAEFNADHPRILGGVLNLVAEGLRRGPTFAEHLPTDCRAPMMAAWAEAARSLYPVRIGVSFADALTRNRTDANIDAVEASLLGRLIVRLLDDAGGTWRGSTQALIEALRPLAPDPLPRDFPANVYRMRSALARLAPALISVGVTVESGRESGSGSAGMRSRFLLLSSSPSVEREGSSPSSPPPIS